MRKRILIGTSGWMYPEFKPALYGAAPRRDWLTTYARRFATVEVNASFYRLQAATTYARWQAATPADFRFSIKANRYLINRRLLEPAEPIRHECERADALGAKLAAVLWQLPARFARNDDRLEQFAAALAAWPNVHHVIEFRHRSWFVEEVHACLVRHGIVNCLSDAADWPMWDAVAGPLAYVRLHGHTRTYESSYARRSLERWAARAARWQRAGLEVYIYFDNTAQGAALHNAVQLAELVEAVQS